MKKIICAVIAAALFGANAYAFTDMADSEASFIAEKLGIISGYEDGTFRPQNEVTRGEAAKMLARLIDFDGSYTEAVERDMKDYTPNVADFDDYDPNYWANAYIQIGLNNNFISGFDDNTFRPEEKVTLAELLTMLTQELGYSEFAKATGGYPSGYIQWANSQGITQYLDVKNGDYKKNATRGEVLDCMFGALHTPLCVISAFTTTWDGVTMVPQFEIKDGIGEDWQTLLTHDGIHSGDAELVKTEKDTAVFKVTSSPNFIDQYADEDSPFEVKVKFDGNVLDGMKRRDKCKLYVNVLDYDTRECELFALFNE